MNDNYDNNYEENLCNESKDYLKQHLKNTFFHYAYKINENELDNIINIFDEMDIEICGYYKWKININNNDNYENNEINFNERKFEEDKNTKYNKLKKDDYNGGEKNIIMQKILKKNF